MRHSWGQFHVDLLVRDLPQLHHLAQSSARVVLAVRNREGHCDFLGVVQQRDAFEKRFPRRPRPRAVRRLTFEPGIFQKEDPVGNLTRRIPCLELRWRLCVKWPGVLTLRLSDQPGLSQRALKNMRKMGRDHGRSGLIGALRFDCLVDCCRLKYKYNAQAV